ncbi:MAG: HD domain-containing protein [Clostridia bacterium]|nr:HD domain-containing protein [Clostridia bacterium]
MLKLSKGAEKAIKMLTHSGYEAYSVGGAIRDLLMEKEANDFDVTTSATPEEMKTVFSSERLIETGIKHGTLTVVIEGESVEITTYRLDGDYDDNRHPKSVEFTRSLSEDLSRRDFTVNALAYNPISETLVDLFNGRGDIEKGVIRAIGEPKARFTEDALRILRAIRFSSTLGFSIDEKTKEAMLECAPLLENISKERIATELNKFLCGKNVKNAILENYEILSFILPEIKAMHGFNQRNSWHIYDILTHTAIATEKMPPMLRMRLMAFLHDIGKVHTFTIDEKGIGHFYGHNRVSAEIAKKFFEDYKYDNFTKERCCKIISLHDTPIEEDKVYIKKRLNRMGAEAFFELLALQRADNLAQSPEKVSINHFSVVEKLANEILAENECFSLKNLAINGSHLIENGFKAGKQIGEILDYLLNEVIEERAENKKEILLALAKAKFGG